MKRVKNIFGVLAVAGCLAWSGCATTGVTISDAAMNNDTVEVRRMLDQGYNADTGNMFGLTPLYFAAFNGNAEMAELLLDKGANPNVMLMGGLTPFTAAIYKAHTNVVRLMITKGANVNIVSNYKHKFTPILYCGAYGNAEIAKMLIDAGADINARDNRGRSAVDMAREYKKIEVIAALGKGGAQVSYTGDAARDVVMAAISGDREKVRSLVEEGVDPNSKSSSGKSLLEYAVDNKWYKVAELLIQKGANTAIKDKDGWTMLMKAYLDNQKELVAAFERGGAKLAYTGNKKDDLLYAVLQNDYEKAKLLLAQGADVNGTYRYKSPILNYAIVKKDARLIKLFIENNADLNLANQYGVSPFIAALSNGDVALAREMVAKGANVNARDSSGASALFYAVKTGDAGFVKTLLDKGAQADAASVMLSEGRNTNFKGINFPQITVLIKPELLRRQMLRAEAAQEVAQSVEDYQKVLAEYEVAKTIAPETPEIWYNIGLIQDKAGNFNEAIANLRKYLQLAPDASDAQAVKDMIYKIEYKLERK